MQNKVAFTPRKFRNTFWLSKNLLFCYLQVSRWVWTSQTWVLLSDQTWNCCANLSWKCCPCWKGAILFFHQSRNCIPQSRSYRTRFSRPTLSCQPLAPCCLRGKSQRENCPESKREPPDASGRKRCTPCSPGASRRTQKESRVRQGRVWLRPEDWPLLRSICSLGYSFE